MLSAGASVAADWIVVNPSAPVTTLSSNAVRAIFGMRLRNWPDNTPIRVFVLNDDHPTHRRFAKHVLSIFPHQLRRAWDRLVYSGTGQAPITVDSVAAMRDQLAGTPGAIGYLPESEIDRGQVRPVEIQ